MIFQHWFTLLHGTLPRVLITRRQRQLPHLPVGQGIRLLVLLCHLLEQLRSAHSLLHRIRTVRFHLLQKYYGSRLRI